MTFGPYPKGRCFHIEESKCYEAIRGKNVKMAEFLLLHTSRGIPVIWVVEAKSSAPRRENQPDFDDYIAEIREKLINAFSLGWASCLKRHPKAEAELPEGFKTLNLSQVNVKFFLVIKGDPDDGWTQLQNALIKELRPTVKCWAFKPNYVAVIDDKKAQKNGLILSAP